MAVALAVVGCSQPTDGTSESVVAPATEPYVISPVEVAGALSSREGAEFAQATPRETVSHLVAKYGPDAVVALVVEPFPAQYNRLLHDRLGRTGGRLERFSHWQGERAVTYAAPVTDLDQFARALDLGEYEVEATRRIVRIRASLEGHDLSAQRGGPRPPPSLTRRAPEIPRMVGLEIGEVPPEAVLLVVHEAGAEMVPRLIEHIGKRAPQLQVQHRPIPNAPATFHLLNVRSIEQLPGELAIGSHVGVDLQRRLVSIVLDPNLFVDFKARAEARLAAQREERNSPEQILEDLRSGPKVRAFSLLESVELGALRGGVEVELRRIAVQGPQHDRGEAIRALMALGGDDLNDFLASILYDDDSSIRVDAALALAQRDDPRAIEPLVQMLESPTGELKVGDALRRFGAQSEPHLLALLDRSEDEWARRNILLLLADVGGAASHDHLLQTRSLSDPVDERDLHETMQAIRQRGEGAELTASQHVAAALRKIREGHGGLVDSGLKDLLKVEPVPDLTVEVLRTVFPLVDDVWTRNGAMDVVARWYIPPARRRVFELTSHADVVVQRKAFAILGTTDDPEVATMLVPRLRESYDYAARALRDLGSHGEQALLAALEDPNLDEELGRHCLRAIGQIGTEASLPRLAVLQQSRTFNPRLKLGVASARLSIRVDLNRKAALSEEATSDH